MEPKENEKISAERYTYQSIKNHLLGRRLAPGAQLTEKSICTTFNVGRTPARAALKRLAEEGYVEIIPNHGARVVVGNKKQMSDYLDVRSGLLMIAVEKCISLYTKKDIENMENAIALEKEAFHKYDFQQYLDSIQQFHLILLEKADNKLLIRLYENVNNRIRILLILYDDFYKQERRHIESVYTHENIVNNIKVKNVNKIRNCFSDYSTRIVRTIWFSEIPEASLSREINKEPNRRRKEKQ